jgi:hypothetical protein
MTVSEVTLLGLFAYGLMTVIALLTAVLVRGMVTVLGSMHKKPAIAAPATPMTIAMEPEASEEEERARHVAAVAAAVYAVLGAHRLVYIGEVGRAPSWSTTGRTIQHISHSPKRSPERR